MSKTTSIAWTDHTFNIAWGCTKVSPGCAHCYADTLSARYGHDVWGPHKPRRTLSGAYWKQPLEWNAEAEAAGVNRRIFCSSMCDIFEDHPTIEQERAKLWPLVRATPNLTWQLLTKRAERLLETAREWIDLPNVWMGVSVESDDYTCRAAMLGVIPARVRFVSYEPALGPLKRIDLRGIHWLICGGESGPKHRPMQMEWARNIRDRCAAEGVAFFFKQSSGPRPGMGCTLDGVAYREFPE